jgi:hypothetical protein
MKRKSNGKLKLSKIFNTIRLTGSWISQQENWLLWLIYNLDAPIIPIKSGN